MKSKQQQQQQVRIQVMNYLQIYPSMVKSLHCKDNMLYVCRQSYSQIIKMDNQPSTMYQVARLSAYQHIIKVEQTLLMFSPYCLYSLQDNQQELHSFTSQLLSIRQQNNLIYSFHQQQSILWIIEEKITYKYLSVSNTPYHINLEGVLAGFGKKVKPNIKVPFICCEVLQDQFVFVGDQQGKLHIYNWQHLAHVRSIYRHQGAILAIKVDSFNKVVYFTGSDSKISVLKYQQQQWSLSREIRGQTHDILGLELYSSFILSGGLTTDFCWYDREENGQLSGKYYNIASYCNQKVCFWQKQLILVNKYSSLELWRNSTPPELLVRYETKGDIIQACGLSKELANERQTYLIVISTEQKTMGWKFNIETGFIKHFTISTSYLYFRFLPHKTIFLALKYNSQIQKVHCKNGKIDELMHSQVFLPTIFQLQGPNLVLIASQISLGLKLYNYHNSQELLNLNLNTAFIICGILESSVMVQYLGDDTIYSISKGQEKAILKCGHNFIRFGGWLNQRIGKKSKKFWYGVTHNRILLITNMHKQNNSHKIRTKRTHRIATSINQLHSGSHLGIVPIDFNKMINCLPVMPVLTKKIL